MSRKGDGIAIMAQTTRFWREERAMSETNPEAIAEGSKILSIAPAPAGWWRTRDYDSGERRYREWYPIAVWLAVENERNGERWHSVVGLTGLDCDGSSDWEECADTYATYDPSPDRLEAFLNEEDQYLGRVQSKAVPEPR